MSTQTSLPREPINPYSGFRREMTGGRRLLPKPFNCWYDDTRAWLRDDSNAKRITLRTHRTGACSKRMRKVRFG